MPSEVKQYQEVIANSLRRIYAEVKTEWASLADEMNMYCPRVDIAVGPFATNQSFITEYDALMESSRGFINGIIDYHLENLDIHDDGDRARLFDELKSKNQNARCLMAIEIENKVSRKHLMGSAINAAALGRIGIAVAWTSEKLRAFVKLQEYLRFLDSVGKNTFDTTNLLILNSTQFRRAIEENIGTE
jgi:hypothetical protein